MEQINDRSSTIKAQGFYKIKKAFSLSSVCLIKAASAIYPGHATSGELYSLNENLFNVTRRESVAIMVTASYVIFSRSLIGSVFKYAYKIITPSD
jgi:hypothetical protein